MAYPCGDCGGICITDVICCDNCENRFPYKCQNLLLKKNVTEIRSRKNSLCDYVCTKCTKTVDGNFDFEKSLKRLEKYSLSGHLEAGARIERLLLRHENNKPLGSRKDFVYSPDSLLGPDPVSKMVLENHKISFDGKIPVFVSGDGKCLFNSLSVGLVGHEKLATEIRVRTCLEMVLNRHAYYDGPNAKKNERLLEVTDSYDEACNAASRKGAFSSAWTMLAAATVLGCPIQSVFPPRNGRLDKAFCYLNETFTPVSSKSKFDPICIMWTSTSYSYHKTWLPNHFVPLIATKEQSIIDLDSVEDFPPLSSTSLDVSCNPCPTIFDSPILRLPEVLEASVKLEASVPSVSSEVLADDSPSPQEPASVRPLTKLGPTVQSFSSEIVKDKTLSPQEPSSKRSLTTDLTTDTISSSSDTTNLQNFDEI